MSFGRPFLADRLGSIQVAALSSETLRTNRWSLRQDILGRANEGRCESRTGWHADYLYTDGTDGPTRGSEPSSGGISDQWI
jgi:hypothetical protein